MTFSRKQWTKAALVINEHDARPLETHNHVWFVIAIHICERKGNGNKIIIRRIELWANINLCMCSISTRQLNYLDTSIKVNSDEMTWSTSLLVMTNELICLECSWTTIAYVVHGCRKPAENAAQERPEKQHCNHANTKI